MTPHSNRMYCPARKHTSTQGSANVGGAINRLTSSLDETSRPLSRRYDITTDIAIDGRNYITPASSGQGATGAFLDKFLPRGRLMSCQEGLTKSSFSRT